MASVATPERGGHPARAVLLWGALGAAVAVPVLIALFSPLLEWRGPIYIAGGFAGMLALGALLAQPLLAANALPGPSPAQARRWHARLGTAIVALVVAHVVGLWVTSPPDVIDVLLFRSPTPFSVWGAVAMWAVFAAGLLAATRRRLRWRPRTWRRAHAALAAVTVGATAAHALLIEGAMGTGSKAALCAAVVAATAWAVLRSRARRAAPDTPTPR